MDLKRFKAVVFLVLLSLSLWGCGADDSPKAGGCIEVRLIDQLCGEAIIQVISPDFVDLGEDSWTDWQGNTFEAVFFTRLSCEDMANVPTDGSSFYITITESAPIQDCVVCDAILTNRPERSHNIRVIGICANTL